MNIGNVEINGRAVLAPLAGITDLPFRMVCKRFGAALVYTEMISCEGLVRIQKRTLGITATVPSERPVNFQIFGNNIEAMARAAAACSTIGADLVDINMGCPVRKVVKGRSGSALLKDLDHSVKLIRAVVDASSVPVTIKVRTGWGAADFVAAELAVAAQEAGVAAVAVHGRYALQGFSGKADWSAIRRVKESVTIPVIGNGDIHGARDAARMIEETGCDLVMVGRAALGNPWIFRDINEYIETGVTPEPPSLYEKGEVLLDHMRAMVAAIGEKFGIQLMRKHGAWYSRGYHGSSGFRQVINHAGTMTEFEDAVNGFFMCGEKSSEPVCAQDPA